MPLYEYDCETCGETIEVLQRAGASAPPACGEDCALEYGAEMGAGRLRRRMSVPGGYVMGARRPQTSVRAPDPSCGHCGQDPNACHNREGEGWS